MNSGKSVPRFQYREGFQNLMREEILELYKSVGWSGYTENPDNLLRALANSTYLVTCQAAGTLVGLARSISDDSAIHYLQDILVRPEYQKQGIGRTLLGKCLKRFEHVRAHVLLTDDEQRQELFYRSMGFCNTKNWPEAPLNCFVKFKNIAPD